VVSNVTAGLVEAGHTVHRGQAGGGISTASSGDST
jgi:hypothetical protein